MKKTFKWIFILCLLSACAHMRSGKYVKINSVKDLSYWATNYNISVEDIKMANQEIKANSWVFIPTKVGIMKSRRGGGVPQRVYDDKNFTWPVPRHLKVSSYYGKRGRRNHHGIDIPAPSGTSVLASKSGKVLFSGRMRGYGKVVIVSHGNRFHTVYAHNSRNLVRKGTRVAQGEKIALIGRTGRATGNHLHFEIRISDRSVNPLPYLRGSSSLASR